MPSYTNVVLIDDDAIDNLINQKIMESNNFAENIQVFKTGQDALDYLQNTEATPDQLPDLIFLGFYVEVSLLKIGARQILPQNSSQG